MVRPGVRGSAAALGADAGGPALSVLPAGPLAFHEAGGFGVAPRFSLGTQPGVAGAARRIPLLLAGRAQAALRCGRDLAALHAQAGFEARGGAPGDALAVALTADRRIGIGHAILLNSWGERKMWTSRGAGGQPFCLRSMPRPIASQPQICTPPRVLSPVQMMISVRPGRIASACLRETTVCFALPRPFALGASAGGGNNVAVRAGPVPFDHVPVVGQAGAEEMNQERVRRVAGNRQCCRHGAVSFVPMRENGGRTPSPGHPTAAPFTAKARPLGGGERFAADEGNGRSTGTGG